jgi:hypothetical protein
VKETFARNVLMPALLACSMLAVSCGGGDEIQPGGQLFTTAPVALTLNTGSTATYKVNGGTPVYAASSGNTDIARVSLDGPNLSITAVSAGSVPITIVDSAGSKVTINLTAQASGAQQGTGGPLSLSPAALTIGNCTTRVPFIFNGGVAPYTIFTSDNFNVPVSSPLSLGDGRFYFFADVHYALQQFPTPTTVATLTVLDSESRVATASITTPTQLQACSSNPLLVVLPETANFRTSEVIAFQIFGGSSSSNPTVTFADAGVAQIVSVSPTTVTIQAVSSVRATTLMTIAIGNQRASVVVNVLPQP